MVDKKVTKQVKASLQENVTYLNSILPVSESFDLIQRDMIIGEKQSTFYFIDGFTKDETMLKIMTSFFALKKDDMPSNATGFSTHIQAQNSAVYNSPQRQTPYRA